MTEARILYGCARPFGCLVSIGTGMSPNIALPDSDSNPINNAADAIDVAKAVISLATASQQAHLLAQQQFTEFFPHVSPIEVGAYYRFNAGKKIPNTDNWEKEITLDDYKAMPGLEAMTNDYLKDAATVTMVGQCAARLNQLVGASKL